MGIGQISSIIFGLIGGLGLFLFGMKLMSEGLQKSSGDSLKRILEKLTTNRIIGTGVGAVVTMIIQSSSATTVMVVGFVNAGLMNLTQALSVILGANVGTTITAQIIAFKITAISLPCIGVGVLLILFARRPMLKYVGEIIFGFGLLFFGMDIMTKAFIPLAKSDAFRSVFLTFSSNPILAVIAGAVTTLVVQSSSATIGITIALATTGAIDFHAAAALVLGENIGTTITANLAALNASRPAKQAALGHFLLNTIGVTYMLILLTPFIHLVSYLTAGDPAYMAPNGTYPYMARHIANIHTIFNIINTIIFLPFLPLLSKLCEKIIKPDTSVDELPKFVHLSDALMKTPEIAVGLAQKEVYRMFGTSLEIFKYAKGALLADDKEAAKLGKGLDEHLMLFKKEISDFLGKLSEKQLSARSERMMKNMLHAIDEIYEIGQRAQKLIKTSQKMTDKEVVFTPEAAAELEMLFDKVLGFTSTVYGAYSKGEKLSADLASEEEFIDKYKKTYKKNHIKRLNEGKCSLDAGLIFVDLLGTLEKIGDNTYSITQLLTNKQ